jgi:Protein of unknown function (DUF3592)
MSLTSKILICLGVGVLFVAIALIVALNITDRSKYQTLSQGVGVYGTVASKDAANHQIVRYTFQVGAQSYDGVGHGGHGNPSFDNLNVGDRVVVFYDPNNPTLSCMGYPQSQARVNNAGIMFMVIAVPLWPVAMTILILVIVSKRGGVQQIVGRERRGRVS